MHPDSPRGLRCRFDRVRYACRRIRSPWGDELMRVVAVACVLMCGALVMAQLPPVDKLPDRPELPDPLVALDGSKIASKDDWLGKRRPELQQLFQHYMYGYFPAKPDNVR